MRLPQPIPYQGSKRNQANTILSYFPKDIDRLIEPFGGSIAISIAAAYYRKVKRFLINDINKPLIDLLDEIINNPESISNKYSNLWKGQIGRERQYYDKVRNEFNKSNKPEYFLYLLARCVKASVRYNLKGEFNQSPDNRRKGRKPESMRSEIFLVSKLLNGKTLIDSKDYKKILQDVSQSDLVYMDPPYQGVCNNRDTRYYKSINYEEFIYQLRSLCERGISYILSYDGRRGDKIYGKHIPEDVGVVRLEIKTGRSTQSTLLGGSDVTYESIYLSNALVERLSMSPEEIEARINTSKPIQHSLFQNV